MRAPRRPHHYNSSCPLPSHHCVKGLFPTVPAGRLENLSHRQMEGVRQAPGRAGHGATGTVGRAWQSHRVSRAALFKAPAPLLSLLSLTIVSRESKTSATTSLFKTKKPVPTSKSFSGAFMKDKPPKCLQGLQIPAWNFSTFFSLLLPFTGLLRPETQESFLVLVPLTLPQPIHESCGLAAKGGSTSSLWPPADSPASGPRLPKLACLWPGPAP